MVPPVGLLRWLLKKTDFIMVIRILRILVMGIMITVVMVIFIIQKKIILVMVFTVLLEDSDLNPNDESGLSLSLCHCQTTPPSLSCYLRCI